MQLGINGRTEVEERRGCGRERHRFGVSKYGTQGSLKALRRTVVTWRRELLSTFWNPSQTDYWNSACSLDVRYQRSDGFFGSEA